MRRFALFALVQPPALDVESVPRNSLSLQRESFRRGASLELTVYGVGDVADLDHLVKSGPAPAQRPTGNRLPYPQIADAIALTRLLTVSRNHAPYTFPGRSIVRNTR